LQKLLKGVSLLEEKSIALAIMQIYPHLQPGIDFRVVSENGEQWIEEWYSADPKPTLEELDEAWNDYIANPPQDPLSPIEQLQKDQADLMFNLMLKGVI
jgi:hypothetical protein